MATKTKTAKINNFQIVELYYEPHEQNTLDLVKDVAYLTGKGFELIGKEGDYRFMDYGQHEAEYRQCFSFISANKSKEFIKFYKLMDRAKIVHCEFDEKDNIISETVSEHADWAEYFWQHTDDNFSSMVENAFKVKSFLLNLKSPYDCYEISFQKSFKKINLAIL